VTHTYRCVDVFGSGPLTGNPVAVVHDADDLSEDQMAAFARWTNLSETTFLLRPTDPAADYRLRIFTPGEELPFAGHPTLGSAHAWLGAGGVPATPGVLVQECGAGLVRVHRGERLALEAPPLVRSGPVSADDLTRIARALRIDEAAVVDAEWIDNGPGWVGVLLADAAAVTALRPDWAAFDGLDIGVAGLHGPGGEVLLEVRAFCPGLGITEDPVTGSLQAGLGQWLTSTGRLPASYVAAQGAALQRRGRVHVDVVDGQVRVAGSTVTTVEGRVAFAT
jgi:PhzF family phenazine biosynthesis protein